MAYVNANAIFSYSAADESGISSSTTDNQIISAKALNSTSVSLTFAEKSKDCNIEVSQNGVDWDGMECVENTVAGLEPGKKYQFRLKNTASNKVEVTLPGYNQTSATSCTYKGKTYKLGTYARAKISLYSDITKFSLIIIRSYRRRIPRRLRLLLYLRK